MKSVRCLLMGSAAGLAVVSAAQAADLPVKAAPVEYVKVCSLYGAGFWYVPGTDTCIKIGSYVRAEFLYGQGDTEQRIGGPGSGTGARFTRTDTSLNQFRYRGQMSFDLRTQTEYGTLRSYMSMGTQWTSDPRWPNTSISTGGSTDAALNSQFNNMNV